MEQNPLISIIIPVFNVEKYLTQCLMSVAKQTYSNIEIICIDDGSTDRSGIICDEFAKEDSRFRVIHQKNAGAGAARNAGLKMAQGEYIGFVDSDDYVDQIFYETLWKQLREQQAQIACCDTVQVYRNRIDRPESGKKIKVYSNTDFFKLAAEHWRYYIMVNKLFCRQIIENIYFPEGQIIDDGFFTYELIARATKIVWCPQALYYYRQRSSSVMNLEEFRSQRDQDALVLHRQRLEFVKRKKFAAVGVFQRKMLDTYLNVICNGDMNQNQIMESIHYMRRNCWKAIVSEYKAKEKIWWIMLLCFPKIMIRRRIRKMGKKTQISQDQLYD